MHWHSTARVRESPADHVAVSGSHQPTPTAKRANLYRHFYTGDSIDGGVGCLANIETKQLHLEASLIIGRSKRGTLESTVNRCELHKINSDDTFLCFITLFTVFPFSCVCVCVCVCVLCLLVGRSCVSWRSGRVPEIRLAWWGRLP